MSCPHCGEPHSAPDCPHGVTRLDPDEVRPTQADVGPAGSAAGAAPRRVGPYEVLEVLGQGGMGTVYRARHRSLGREVALKVMKGGALASGVELERFRREGEAVAGLSHPGIVALYEVGTFEGQPYFAMEYVRGRPLDRVLHEERIRVDRALSIAAELGRALDHAHRQLVVHRDLKPANVLLDEEGRARLTDFGLARRIDSESALTVSGAVMGTPAYMSPEQARGDSKRVDARSDVYGLGAILYELLTLEPPHRGETLMEVVRHAAEGDPVPPRKLAPRLPRDVETICLKALARERERRYATAGEFADDVERYLRREPIRGRPRSIAYGVRRWLQRHPVGAVAGLGALAVVAAVATLLPRLLSAEAEVMSQLRTLTDAYLEAALASRRAGDVERMIEYGPRVEEACRSAAAQFPDQAEPHYRLGRMYRALMREEEALAEQEAALAIDPDDPLARYEHAVLVFKRLLQRVGRILDGERRAAGALLVAEGAPVRARERLRPPRVVVEGDPEARGLLRRLEEDLRRLEGAQGTLGEGPRDCARALLAWARGDAEESCRLLEAAIDRDRRLEEAYDLLCVQLMDDRRYEAAAEWWTRGLDADRGYFPHHSGRAEARYRIGFRLALEGRDPAAEFQASVDDYGEAARLAAALGVRQLDSMQVAGVYAEWAIHRIGRGEDASDLLRRCIADCDRAIKDDPLDGEPWRVRGSARAHWAVQEIERGGEARELCDLSVADLGEAIRLRPEDARARMDRGVSRLNRAYYLTLRQEDPGSDFDEAIADLDAALAADPEVEAAWMGRGNAFVNRGMVRGRSGEDSADDFERAVRDLTYADALAPDCADVLCARGLAHANRALLEARMGRDPHPYFRLAFADYDRSLAIDGKYGRTLSARGYAYYCRTYYESPDARQADYAAALADFEAAIVASPNAHARVEPLAEQCRQALGAGGR